MTVSTAAQIRAAWKSNIFDHTSVQAITTAIYDYNLQPASQSELEKLYYNKEVNYIEYIVSRIPTPMLCGAVQYKYTVDISIIRKADALGLNFNRVLDTAELILTLVASELTTDWTGLVDYYENPDSPPVAEYQLVSEVPCYRTRLQISGIKIE